LDEAVNNVATTGGASMKLRTWLASCGTKPLKSVKNGEQPVQNSTYEHEQGENSAGLPQSVDPIMPGPGKQMHHKQTNDYQPKCGWIDEEG